MPQLRKGDLALQPGYFDQVCDFYTVDSTQDASGAVIDPASEAVGKTLAYTLYANVAPYQGQETIEARTKIGEVFVTMSIRYFPSRIPIEGMRVVHKLTGYEYEITAVEPIAYTRTKIELTCKLIR